MCDALFIGKVEIRSLSKQVFRLGNYDASLKKILSDDDLLVLKGLWRFYSSLRMRGRLSKEIQVMTQHTCV